MKYLLLLLAISSLALAETTSRTKVLMGTFVTISTEIQDKKHIENGFKIISEVESSISSYDKQSQIYRLNRDKKSSIDATTYEALRLSREYYEKSDGYFDITIGSITKDLYRFGEEERVATSRELKNAVVNFNGLSFNKNKARLEKGVKVDLGGMGKGFGVDKAADYFRKQMLKNVTISASGDIRCLGLCHIDVQNPFGEGILAAFETLQEDMGVSTSGNYNRYVESLRNNHLIDPKSKASQDKFISITLISKMPSSHLDAFATTASVMPTEEAYEFLDSLKLAYIVLQSDMELVVSQNIFKYVDNLLINNTPKK
ncbi:MAG: FAD:protein FMN transferase [Campylobacterota bacterium]